MANVAFLIAPDFEDIEYAVPNDRLLEAGHDVVILGSRGGETVVGKRMEQQVAVESAARDRDPDEFHALVIPGGYAPDKLRADPSIVAFVRRFAETGRPIAAVCHGPQVLIEAELVRGKRVTSWPSVRKDLENAGAAWVDREVVIDGPLITSRKPADLGAFSDALLDTLR